MKSPNGFRVNKKLPNLVTELNNSSKEKFRIKSSSPQNLDPKSGRKVTSKLDSKLESETRPASRSKTGKDILQEISRIPHANSSRYNKK